MPRQLLTCLPACPPACRTILGLLRDCGCIFGRQPACSQPDASLPAPANLTNWLFARPRTGRVFGARKVHLRLLDINVGRIPDVLAGVKMEVCRVTPPG